MSTIGRTALRALALLGLLLLLTPAAAQAWREPIPIGDPIENDNWWLRPIEGTFRLEAARAPDPDGGPRWAIGTLRAKIDIFPPGTPDSVCTVLGRVVGGKFGLMTADGVFRPFAPGAGAGYCSAGEYEEMRAPITEIRVGTSVFLDASCMPRPVPEDPTIPVCDPAIVRTFHSALLGPGRFRAWAPGDHGVRPVPVESDGSLLVVERGMRERFAVPVVSFRICGPHARPDLVEFGVWGTIRGCRMTMTIVPQLWSLARAGEATQLGGCSHAQAGSRGPSVTIGRTVEVCTPQDGQ